MYNPYHRHQRAQESKKPGIRNRKLNITFRPLPPLEYLRECFEVSPESPSGLFWKHRPAHHFGGDPKRVKYVNRQFGGKKAGSCHPKTNQWRVAIGSDRHLGCHRIIWALTHNEDPSDCVIDHIDGNHLNNQAENLRKVTWAQNAANRIRKNDGQQKGVYFNKRSRRWTAAVHLHLGYYDTEDEAAEVYRAAAEILHGKFAVHMRPPAIRPPLPRHLRKGPSLPLSPPQQQTEIPDSKTTREIFYRLQSRPKPAPGPSCPGNVSRE